MALSGAERQQRLRDRRRAEQEVRDKDAKRKRDERAAKRAPRPTLPAPAASLVEYVEGIVVTQGDHIGDPFTVLPWQRAYLAEVEASAGGELGLSVAAGAGKSTLLGAICAAGVYGLLAKPRADVICVAGSFGQTCLTFDAALAFLQPLIEADPKRVRMNRSEQTALVEDRETGAKLKASEASARTLHGAIVSLIVADDPAQWLQTQRDAIYSALRSRLGKVPGSRPLAIGTRPDDPGHWFARLLQRSRQVYAADPDGDPFDPAQWAQANSSLVHLPALRAVYQREAEEAKADPSLLPAFKALRLNQGTADHEIHVLIDAEAWERCEVDLLPAARGPCCWASTYPAVTRLRPSLATGRPRGCCKRWPRSRGCRVWPNAGGWTAPTTSGCTMMETCLCSAGRDPAWCRSGCWYKRRCNAGADRRG